MKNNSQLSTLYSPLLIIPAIKKNAVIPDQLIKKLNGITLIQRAINTAREVTQDILIITDSEEISVIAERNNIRFYLNSTLILNSENIVEKVKSILNNAEGKNIIIYRANTPLVNSVILKKAYSEFLLSSKCILTSVKILDGQLLTYKNDFLKFAYTFLSHLILRHKYYFFHQDLILNHRIPKF